MLLLDPSQPHKLAASGCVRASNTARYPLSREWRPGPTRGAYYLGLPRVASVSQQAPRDGAWLGRGKAPDACFLKEQGLSRRVGIACPAGGRAHINGSLPEKVSCLFALSDRATFRQK